MDSASGFSNFKKALLEIDISYDDWKKAGKPVQVAVVNGEVVEVIETPLERLAKEISGRVWIKGDKRRIYNPYGQGDNYHYQGKWWLEFDDDGEFVGKAWLDGGYSNKKSEEYMAKHIRQMEQACETAMEELSITCIDLAIFESEEAKEKRIEGERVKQQIIDEKVAKVVESQIPIDDYTMPTGAYNDMVESDEPW
jgi:hypothetical protein